MAAWTEPRSLRVLIVDACADVAEVLELLLTMWGHEPRTAPDGPSALEAAAEFLPDVVLMDIPLPGLDGWELARRLRRMPELGGALLIAATSCSREEDLRRSRQAGIDHHLTKPVYPQDLRDLLSAWAQAEAPEPFTRRPLGAAICVC